MNVKRLTRVLLVITALAFALSACTGSKTDTPTDTPSVGANIDSGSGSGEKAAIAVETVHNSACYYAPLPGAFRLYCPDFKSTDGTCSSRSNEVDVSYVAGSESRSAVGRKLTSNEKAAVPDACFAVDLPLLPNADNKLSYHLGGKKFQIMAYLPFGNGSVP